MNTVKNISIRDLFWFVLVAGLAIGWFADRRALQQTIEQLRGDFQAARTDAVQSRLMAENAAFRARQLQAVAEGKASDDRTDAESKSAEGQGE